MTCFSPASLFVDLLRPDGSWEDGPGHCGSVRLQEGVAPASGGAVVPKIPLDRGAGAVDPRAATWRHQPGGEQESHHVGHPPNTKAHLYRHTRRSSSHCWFISNY